jgi:recombination endonuclease VII
METQNVANCEFCGRPIRISTSNHNKGLPIKCACQQLKQQRTRQLEWYHRNKERMREYQREYFHRNKERILARHKVEWQSLSRDQRYEYKLKNKYGITLADYRRMEAEQEGKCFLCSCEAKLHVDHHHAKNQVRKLLCGECNKALGFIERDIQWVERALQYLKS